MLRDESSTSSNEAWGTASDDRTAGSDERRARLHRRLKRIVKARGALDLAEAAALREAQELWIWRAYGCASLVEYLERELGYTAREAVERLRIANALVELPSIANAMEQGELAYSGVRELTRVATSETEDEWLAASRDKTAHEIQGMVSGRERGARPDEPVDESARLRTVRFALRPETYALLRAVQVALEKERGERLDEDAMMAAMCRRVLDGSGSSRAERAARPSSGTPQEEHDSDALGHEAIAPGRAPYQIAVTLCRRCKRGWQDGGGVTVEMSSAAIERAKCDAQEIGSLDGDATARATQTIPPAIRRQVLRRDHGRCRVPGCRSARNLDIHHVIAREQGGRHTLDNLVTLCEGHHLAHHEGALVITGSAPNVEFTRKPNNGFKRVALAEETRATLLTLKFKSHEVAVAVDKARAEVGERDLPLQDWIKIALRYCPR